MGAGFGAVGGGGRIGRRAIRVPFAVEDFTDHSVERLGDDDVALTGSVLVDERSTGRRVAQMSLDASTAANALVDRVRARPWGLAVVAITENEVEFRFDEGADRLTEDTLFQIGSITKTMTGVLLADSVLREETTLDATLEGVLGADAGRCGAVTLRDLATQRSGLPRLPPNLDLEKINQADPYADYFEADLVEALAVLDPPTTGTYAYSNMGFMVLGLALGRVTGQPFASLVQERLFLPLRMHGARCPAPLESDDVAPGYSGPAEVPWWRTNLPGPGGVGASIGDLASYLAAHVNPEGPLRSAIELATEEHAAAPSAMGLGWGHQGGGLFHDGGTGGFRSFIAFHRPTRTGVALLANSAQADVVTSAGFAVLTDMVRSR